MRSKEELIADVVERFLFHSKKAQSDNPVIKDIAEKMCSVEIWEMWVLTQDRKVATR